MLALVLLIGVIGYAVYLTIGVAAFHLDTNRFVAGLLLGILFARVPRIRQGRLQTIGLIPKGARPWVMASLLVLCALHFVARGAVGPVLMLTMAAIFLVVLQVMKKKLAGRVFSSFMRAPSGREPAHGNDDMIIDAEFREKKD